MNLHVSRISKIRWKNIIFQNFFSTSKTQSSLPQVGCVRGANIFLNHNQFLTRESLTRPAPGFPSSLQLNTRWRLQRTNQSKIASRCRADFLTCDSVTLLSDLFRLSGIRSQSWLWLAWPRDHEVRITVPICFMMIKMIYEMHLCKDQTITLDEVKVYWS